MARTPRIHLDYEPHPLRVYRTSRLAKLFDVDASTIWRWEKDGVLPPAVTLGPGVRGWPEDVIKAWLEERQQESVHSGDTEQSSYST